MVGSTLRACSAARNNASRARRMLSHPCATVPGRQGGTYMAKPGDPFDTEERDQVRSEQRRVARQLDSWFIRTAHKTLRGGELPREADAELLEDIVRAEAAAMIDTHRPLLEQLAIGSRSAALHSFLNSDFALPEPFGDDPLRSWRRAMFAEDPASTGEADEDELQQVQGLAVLLIWADQLAGDGYVHPALR